jgi:ribonuclease J
VVTIAATVSGEGKLITQPEINLRGVVTSVERSLLNQLIIRSIERTITEKWEEYSQSSNPEAQLSQLREEIETNLQRLIKRELQSQPLVIFLLQTAVTESSTSSRVYRRRRSTASIAS